MSVRGGNLIYATVNQGLRLVQPEFFRRIRLEGQPLDDPQEYLMVVANHPYGLQDAFLLSYAYTRPFYFAATALNFQRRRGNIIKRRWFRGWLLTQCQVLPIVRDRSEGHLSTNLETFAKAAEAIAAGSAFGIFAEGDSRGNQWRLLKLKSGAAQIALQVADLLKEQGQRLKIQVAGLTYTNWTHPFKSTVTIRFAVPFQVEPVDLTDRRAVRAARRTITRRMTELMQQHTVHVSERHQPLVGKIAQFYTVNQASDFERLKSASRQVELLFETYAEQLPQLESKLDEYLELADELKIYPGEERVHRNRWQLALLAIPALIGMALHWPIVKATRAVVPVVSTPLHSLGDKRITFGILFTLLWYALLVMLALIICGRRIGWWAVPLTSGIVVAAGSCGLAASRYFRHVMLFLRSQLPSRRRFRRYQQLGGELYAELENRRPAVPRSEG